MATRSASDAFAGDVTRASGSVDLYWIPLGAGRRVVRLTGTLFEAGTAALHRRACYELYHSALEVRVPEGRLAIEQAPVPDAGGEQRGVVASGPVGLRCAGRLRIFRYEIRCWRDGAVPDAHLAVQSPVRISDDVAVARRVLAVLPDVPRLVWGRDQSGAGEMWNSNSVVSWTLARAGLDADAIDPPTGGRAPGWEAGLTVARRDEPPLIPGRPSGAQGVA